MNQVTAKQNWKIAHTPFTWQGKVVLITGAAGGLGKALAREALARGARLALTDHDRSRLEAVAQSLQLNGLHSLHDADLTDSAAAAQLIEEVVAHHGQLDVVINNAGVSMAGRFMDSTIEQFDLLMNINVRAVVALMYAAMPHLKPGAHFVNVSSMSGLVGMPFSFAYSASKFGQRGLNESLRTELPWMGIGLTSVHPGGINTGMHERLLFSDHGPAEEHDKLRQASVKSMKTTSAQKAAKQTLDAAQQRRARLVIGLDAKALDVLSRLAPSTLGKVLARAYTA